MLKAKGFVCLSLACALLPGGPLLRPLPAQAADASVTAQKAAVIYPKTDSPLNNMLMQAMRQDLPTLSYRMLGKAGADPKVLLIQLQEYLKTHPSEAAMHQDLDTLQLGDQSVSWGDVKAISASGVVMVPDWSYGALELTGPHQVGTGAPETWELRAETDLTLNLELYDMTAAAPALASTVRNSWHISKAIPIRDINQLMSLVKDVTKSDVDIHNSLHQILILDVLRKLPTFQQLLGQNPAEYLASESLQAVATTGFAPLVASLKQQSVILPKGGVQQVDMQQNTVKIGYADTDAVKPRVDLGYKILDAQGSEVGYAKVRQFDATTATLQPITVKRDYAIGDQIVPVPKLNLNVVLRGGTTPLWSDYQPSLTGFFAPNVEADVQYDLGQFIGWPELYATLGGGATFVIPAFQTFTPPPMGFTGEIGLLKRWFFRQWILDTGLSGGLLFGLMTNSQPPYDSLTSFGFVGTARVGLSYQFTPEFILGLHTGFRFASGGPWTSAFTGPNYSSTPLSGYGPLIQLNASWTF